MKIHFIAIGGSVMHQLAIALAKKGYEVTGSDDEIFEPAATNLKRAGIYPDKFGWFPERITRDIDAVILGMHAMSDNPELKRALELKLPVYSFPEYIFKESISKKRVAIGGSHGKTTITAMVMHVLRHNGIDFDYLVGARLSGFDQSVRITDAPLIVCEADEYPASTIEKRPKFHFLFPHIAVLSGIAWDHINVFPTFENYCEQFKIFIEKIESGGVLIYNQTDEILRKIVDESARGDIQVIPYDIPDHEIIDGVTRLEIGNETTDLKIFGNHNLLNTHAAYWVCRQLGISDHQFISAIASFAGAAKRLELIYNKNSIRVYRDFAHAPSKVKASTHALKAQFPSKNMVAVLELHTFSSLNADFMKQYKGALDEADAAIVFYSRHALELKRMNFLDPAEIKEGFGKNGLIVTSKKEELERTLKGMKNDNTNFLFMSSGNYDGMDILTTLGLN